MCGIIGILSTTKKDVGLYIYDALTLFNIEAKMLLE